MASPLDAITSGIGNIIGAGNASSAIGSGLATISGTLAAGAGAVSPYNQEGTSTIPMVNDILTQGFGPASDAVGVGRLRADNPVDFNSFASNYNMSPGAQYLLKTAQTSQDNSEASKGGFYSGANMRAQTGIAEGIANQDLLGQYQAMLSGQQQDFSQKETSYQNLFNQEALGEKAGATQSMLAAAGAGPMASLFGQNAQAQQSKGSGIGSLISGVGGLLTGAK